MLEKTKTIIAPVAAAAAMVGTNPNALAADAEANQTQKTVGAIAANQIHSDATTVNEEVQELSKLSRDELNEAIDEMNEVKGPVNQADLAGYVPDEAPSGLLTNDTENALAEIGNQAEDMKFDAAEDLAFQVGTSREAANEAYAETKKESSPVPSSSVSTNTNDSEEAKRPTLPSTPTDMQQPGSEDESHPKDPYQPPQAQNPMGELAPNETGPLNNGLRDGVAVMEQHFSEMTNDPYQPPQAAEAPATKTPATGQNNGSASGAPAEVPAP